MSDDEADPELLELLRQSLGITKQTHGEVSRDTGVLKDADHIYTNAIDVSIDMYGTKSAAMQIYKAMQEKQYSTETWGQHELHPKLSEGFDEIGITNFVFTMDLLNFSFWSELDEEERYQVEYRGKRWTGYNSLVACLRRALDEGIPLTTPRFWRSSQCTDELLSHVFRGATSEQIPLLQERIGILREAGDVLGKDFAGDDDEDDDVAIGADERDDVPAAVNTDEIGEIDEGSPYINSLRNDIDGPTTDQQPESEVTNSATTQQAQTEHQSHNGGSDQSHTDAVSVGDTSTSHDRPEIDPGSGPASSGIANEQPESTADAIASDANETAASHSNTAPTAQSPNSGSIPPNDTAPRPGIRPEAFRPDHAVARLIQKADRSAGKLVNLLAHHFPSFRDECRFERRKVRLLKRAQIFVADFWAALNGAGLGSFDDIDHLTMFADYRVPQVLHSLGVLVYSPPLDHHIRSLGRIESGHTWEVQLRGCSIWAVELIRREIMKTHPDAVNVNAVLIDFFLYDLAKERESKAMPSIPHHRTRSSNY